jgi:hypothetical protein
MPHTIRAVLSVLAATLPAGVAAQAFEGRVTAQMGGNANRPPADVVIYAKGGQSRMESTMGGMPVALIMDYQGGAITTLMIPQRMYVKMDLKQAAAQWRGMTGTTDTTPPTITRTGRRETIAGVSCEHIVFETAGGAQSDVCAAKGMGFFGGGGSMRGGRGAGVPADIDRLMREFSEGFFPLKIENVNGTTRTQVLLVTKIERQAVDLALFQPPADFTEMQMPLGMPGMPTGRP